MSAMSWLNKLDMPPALQKHVPVAILGGCSCFHRQRSDKHIAAIWQAPPLKAGYQHVFQRLLSCCWRNAAGWNMDRAASLVNAGFSIKQPVTMPLEILQ